MLIVMRPDARAEDIERVMHVIDHLGYRGHSMPGESRTAIGITGNPGAIDPAHFEFLPGVAEAIRVTQPYKLISRDLKQEKSVIKVGSGFIGNGDLAIIAGPCALENETQVFTTAKTVAASGAKFFRGGAFKPRTSPYAFQGLGVEGLKMLARVRDEFGLNIVTEAMDEHGIDEVAKYGDCIQIGARNMQNFSLLKTLGKVSTPILLKRGLSSTLKELLMSAEYIVAHGNPNVILCERGIRTFETATRNTCDIAAVAVLNELTHLPVILDPSHATGKRSLVPALSRAAVAIGADGIMVEVHPCPAKAVTEADQGLDVAVEGIRPSAGLFAKLAATGARIGAPRIMIDGESVILAGEPSVTLSGAQVRLPPGAFLQASRESDAVLAGLVKSGVGRAKRVADLFAGIGTFTFALAGSAEVDAFEQDEAAIAALTGAARTTPKLKPVRTFSRDLFRAPLSARELARYDAVVLDPPRAGARAQAERWPLRRCRRSSWSRAIQAPAPATCASSSMAATASRAWSPSTSSCSRRISSWWLSSKSRVGKAKRAHLSRWATCRCPPYGLARSKRST